MLADRGQGIPVPGGMGVAASLIVLCLSVWAMSATPVRVPDAPDRDIAVWRNVPLDWDVELPATVRVSTRRSAIAKIQSDRDELDLSEARGCQLTAAELLSRPDLFFSRRGGCAIDLDLLRSELQEPLAAGVVDESQSFERRLNYAKLLCELGDERGFNWALARLQKLPVTLGRKELLVLFNGEDDWVRTEPVWNVLAPRLWEREPGMEARSLARTHFASRMIAAYKERLTASQPAFNELREDCRRLAELAPTAESFALCQPLLRAPELQEDPVGVQIIESFASAAPADPQLVNQALELAKQHVGDRGWVSYRYYDIICAHGDLRWLPYFEQQLRAGFQGEESLRAIMTRAPARAVVVLQEQIEAGRNFADYLGCLSQLRHVSQQESQALVDVVLRKLDDPRLRDEFGWSLVEALYRLGSDQAARYRHELLLTGVAANPMDRHWELVHLSLDGVLQQLREAGLPTPLSAGQIEALELAEDASVPHADLLSRERLLLAALDHAGCYRRFRSEDYSYETINQLVRDLSSLTQGRLQPEFVTTDVFEEYSRTRFVWRDRAYEFTLRRTNDWYEPRALADVLNAILADAGERWRFVALRSRRETLAPMAFGPPELFRVLEATFQLPVGDRR